LKRLIIVAFLCVVVGLLAFGAGGLSQAQDADQLRDPISVGYDWVQPVNPDALPALALPSACVEVRLDQPPYNYFEPAEVVSDGDGHELMIWELGKGNGPGWLIPATRVVFFVNPTCASVGAAHLRITAVDAPSRRDFDYGQNYHIELLVGSDGTFKVQLITAEFNLRECDTGAGLCRVFPQAGQPQPGGELPPCPGAHYVKTGNGQPLECR
jgi:hypothetical protein